MVIVGEAGGEKGGEGSSLGRREDLRDAGEGGRKSSVLGDDAHAPGAFGGQHATVRQESECPRMSEPLGRGLHDEIAGGRMKNLAASGGAADYNERARAHQGGPSPAMLPARRAELRASIRVALIGQPCVPADLPASLWCFTSV